MECPTRVYVQWFGPDFSEKIIFNDFRNGKYCSVILNIKTKEEKVLDMPVYSVSNDGEFALTLDFSRLHRLRKGMGYSNLKTTVNEKFLISHVFGKLLTHWGR